MIYTLFKAKNICFVLVEKNEELDAKAEERNIELLHN